MTGSLHTTLVLGGTGRTTGCMPTAFREFAQRNAHAWTAKAGA
ncbi:hypothetical protein [Kitasatospora sp. NPDC088861]